MYNYVPLICMNFIYSAFENPVTSKSGIKVVISPFFTLTNYGKLKTNKCLRIRIFEINSCTH